MKYKSFNDRAQELFGKKVYKLALFGGNTCPNRDGALFMGGCAFCAEGSAHFSALDEDVYSSIEKAKTLVRKKAGEDAAYIAYFQGYTSTYVPLERLRNMLLSAAAHPEICALSIGTRPDCLPAPVMDILSEVNSIKPVCVELGLQTSRADTALKIKRGFTLKTYDDAVKRLGAHGMETVTHAIIGLPGESAEDVKNTVLHAYAAGSRGIKLQLLHILRGTVFETMYYNGQISCLAQEEYIDILKYVLKALPDDMVVHRLTGDGAKSLLIAPLWSADKKRVLNAISKMTQEG